MYRQSCKDGGLLYGEDRIRVVKEGDTLDLGRKGVKFPSGTKRSLAGHHVHL